MVDLVIGSGVADVVELLDDAGEVVGTAPRSTVHHDRTPRHRAFSAYLVDPAGRVLLTRRALTKQTWPGVWSNSCCGHPRPGESGAAALVRRVGEELGSQVRDVCTVLPLFSYVARDPSGVVENELCPVYRAVVADPDALRPDPDEVIDLQWVAWDDLVGLVQRTPGMLSPWCVRQVQEMVSHGLDPVTTPPPEVAGVDPELTLSRVDELLTGTFGDIAASWRRLVVPAAPMLAHDLPAWLGDLTCGHGKRIRPLMCHWGFVAAGGVLGDARHAELVRVAAGLELLHEFALIHDDVMDDSDVRRGVPAAHRQAELWHDAARGRGDRDAFGRNLAILLGDLALVEADRLAAGLRPELRQEWHTMCLELVAGQRGDLTGAATGNVRIDAAERVAALKSGSYTVRRPVLLGALAANARAGALAALRRYGRHAGTAFALRDDVLGIWGDPAVTGKPAGDDLLTGKPTVLAAMAAERLRGPAAAALRRAGTARMTEDDVELVREALVESGIREEVEATIRCHVEQAVDALNGGALTRVGIAGLVELTSRLAWRSA